MEKGITYDRNGKIKTLQNTANGMMDIYTGNYLIGLTESIRTIQLGIFTCLEVLLSDVTFMTGTTT